MILDQRRQPRAGDRDDRAQHDDAHAAPTTRVPSHA